MITRSFFRTAAELEQQNKAFVVVTLTATRGHAPQDAGAKALVTKEGLAWGTVGGGKVEARAIEYAIELLATKRPATQSVNWNLQRDIGMSCGGEVEFLFETVLPVEWKIFVFGAGHVGQALCRILSTLNCRVICVDTRTEWLERLPQDSENLISLRLADYSAPSLASVASAQDLKCSFVVTTRGHSTDVPVLHWLSTIAPSPNVSFGYLGVIGSRVKALKIKNELRALGCSPAFIEQLKCPMGLDIGNSNDPAEIALSIAAELIQRRNLTFNLVEKSPSPRAAHVPNLDTDSISTVELGPL
ncbi:MAG TPA: xanthine dehydrogenase accessory protein XdhC [Oligoflexia bacterium]|nr:xanthine dehydrogenase accessory protein XdhC [Oligoflexia bacterium]